MRHKTVIRILGTLVAIHIFATLVMVGQTTTTIIWTDKKEYSPEETVTIFGSGFNPTATIKMTITRPDGIVDTGYTTSDALGEFAYYYVLDGVTGTYTATATDGANSATTTFIDGAIKPKIWGYTLKPVEGWTHGNVKGYYECQWVPYKIQIESAKSESYELTVVIHHDYYDGTWLGLDDVRNWEMWRNGVPETPSISGPVVNGWVSGLQQLECTWTFTINPGDNCTLIAEAHIAIGAHNWPGSKVHTVIRDITSVPHTPISGGHRDVPIVVEGPPPEADIAIEKLGPLSAHEGETITYTYTVTNPGYWPLSTVTVTDSLGITVTYVSGDDGDGLLEPGEAWIFTALYTVPVGGPDPIFNTATASGTDPSGQPVSDTDTWTVDVLSTGVSVVKSGPAIAQVGQTITYAITVTNTGEVDLYITGLTDTVLGDLSGYITGGVITTVEGFETFTVQYTVLLSDPDPLVNTVTVNGQNQYGQDPVTDSDDHSVNVLHPEIDVEKTGPLTAHEGETITYTYTVTNPGDCELSGVTVNDNVAGSASYVSGDDDGDNKLDPGEAWIFEASYTIPVGGADPLINVATASGTDPLGKTVSDTSTWTVEILVQYYLTVDTDPRGLEKTGGGSATSPPSGWYDECTYVTLTAETVAWYNTTALDRMYTFYYWEIDGQRFGGNPITLHMDANHTAIAVYVRGPVDPIGDVNWDGHIDIRDLSIIAQYFGCTPRSEIYNPACDVNNDGIIDIVDLSTAAKYFGYSQLNPPT